MKYTLAEGVDKTEENVQRGLLVSLPIIFAVLLLAFLGIHHPAKKPTTAGVKSSQTAKAKSSSSKGSTSASVASSTATSPQTPGGNLQVGSSFGAIGPSQPIVGGRGGGDFISPSPSPVPSPAPSPSPAPPPPPTIICDNSKGLLPLRCEACSPPLFVPIGQKVLLHHDGSCTLIN